MAHFYLTSASVAVMADLVLGLAILIYILSLKHKSHNAWLFIMLMTVCVCYYGIDFTTRSGYVYGAQLETGLIGLIFLCQAYFAYMFDGNPFRREMYVLLTLATVIIAFVLYKDWGFRLKHSWDSLTYLIGNFWLLLVFFRKAASAANIKFTGGFSLPSLLSNAKNIINEVRHPTNRQSRMMCAFTVYVIALLVIWANSLYMWWNRPDGPPSFFVLLIAYAAISFANTYLGITYLNFANEKISFQAKLIGVVLCVVLTIFGLMPMMLVQSGDDPGAFTRNTLFTFTILIPLSALIIVLVMPLFLKYNLLKPLDKIVKGVKNVNSGELNTLVAISVNDEFGALAGYFNQMTDSLRQYSEEMEELVAERTNELKHSLEELKSTQSQLIQREKMASLGELTAGIAHEIQNPLNFVNNFSEVNIELITELAQERNKADKDDGLQDELIADIKENLRKISHHGKRADFIVKGMLEHSRKSTGEKQPTDMNVLCDEFLKLSYHGMRAKDKSFNAEMVTHYDANLPKVNVSQQDMGRVMLNLFNNAFYAVHQKAKTAAPDYSPTIEVRTTLAGEQILISVKDNGSGIPENIKDKIMQPFFTTKPTGEGTGLGLSLSYDIAKAHGGGVDVMTKAGEGAEFTVSLPLS